MPQFIDDALVTIANCRLKSAIASYDQFIQEHIDDQAECFLQILRENYQKKTNEPVTSKIFNLNDFKLPSDNTEFTKLYKSLYESLEIKLTPTEANPLIGLGRYNAVRRKLVYIEKSQNTLPSVMSFSEMKDLYSDLGESGLSANDKAAMIGILDSMVETNFKRRTTTGLTRGVVTLVSNARDFITKNKAVSLCLLALAICVATAVVIVTSGLAAPGIAILMATTTISLAMGATTVFSKLDPENQGTYASERTLGKLIDTPEYMMQKKMRDSIQEMKTRENPNLKAKTIVDNAQANSEIIDGKVNANTGPK